jgi:ParB/RepB/Spo0J family partition protein
MSKAETVQKNTKNDYIKVLLSNVIVQAGFNVREELTGIDELARSISINGQVVPGIGFKIRGTEQYVITAGHRRFEAIKLANEKYGAKITHMNVMAGSSDEKERITAMLLDGDASHSLTNLEMVKGISKLLELGLTRKQIVDSLAIGESQAQKYNLVKAAEAPKAVRKMLEDGVISVAKVNEIQRTTKDENEQVELAEKASKEGRKPRSQKKENPTIALLEEALSLSDPTSPKVATLQAIVRKLKSKASAEDIAKLLK